MTDSRKMFLTFKSNEERKESNSFSDVFLKEKIQYILESPSQRSEYKALTSQEDRIRFFYDHFIMTDRDVRQLKMLYLGDEHRKKLFIKIVEETIQEIER